MELLVRHIVTHVLHSIPTVVTTVVRQYGTGAAMTKNCLSCSGVQVLVVMGSRPNKWCGVVARNPCVGLALVWLEPRSPSIVKYQLLAVQSCFG